MTAIPEIIPADAATRRRITVLGAGAWGTAVAMALAARHDVLLWGRNAEAMAAVVLVAGDRLAGLNAKPLARLVGYAHAGVDPAYMGIGPVPLRVAISTGTICSLK